MRTGPNSEMLRMGVKEAVSEHQGCQESLRGHNQNGTADHPLRKVENCEALHDSTILTLSTIRVLGMTSFEEDNQLQINPGN